MHLVVLLLRFLLANGEQIIVAPEMGKPRVSLFWIPATAITGITTKMGCFTSAFVSGNVSLPTRRFLSIGERHQFCIMAN